MSSNILIAVLVSFLLFVFICLNYKMFIIAKSRRTDERVSPTSKPTSSNQERTRCNLNFKKFPHVPWRLAVFHLLFATDCIFCFAFDIEQAFLRQTSHTIQHMVCYVFLYELDVQLSDIFLEKFHLAS